MRSTELGATMTGDIARISRTGSLPYIQITSKDGKRIATLPLGVETRRRLQAYLAEAEFEIRNESLQRAVDRVAYGLRGPEIHVPPLRPGQGVGDQIREARISDTLVAEELATDSHGMPWSNKINEVLETY